jgi:hypothetical protein
MFLIRPANAIKGRGSKTRCGTANVWLTLTLRWLQRTFKGARVAQAGSLITVASCQQAGSQRLSNLGQIAVEQDMEVS